MKIIARLIGGIIAFMEIDWKVFLRVNNEQKTNKLVKRIQDDASIEVQVINCQKYWKDNALYELDCISDVNYNSLAEGVLEVLLMVKKLGSPWIIYGPKIVGNEDDGSTNWAFEGICESPRIPGVHWMQFVLIYNE